MAQRECSVSAIVLTFTVLLFVSPVRGRSLKEFTEDNGSGEEDAKPVLGQVMSNQVLATDIQGGSEDDGFLSLFTSSLGEVSDETITFSTSLPHWLNGNYVSVVSCSTLTFFNYGISLKIGSESERSTYL